MSTTPEFPEPKRPRLAPSMASYPPPSSAEPLPCPRCNSTKTKFCYYNNYNLSQPRHFCRGCRRYWTQGGTLRNIPVGGGTRKKPRLAHHSASPSNSSGSPSSSSLTHETTSVVEKPDLPSDQTQQKQLQLMNLNNNVGSEGGVSLPSMMMMNSQEQQPGFLSLGGYLYGSGYGSGFVHGFQQGYGYGARVDFPAEIVYGAPVVPSSGLEMNTWQMAVADHGGQGGGLVDLPEVQILNNSMPAVIGGGALNDEKVADSSTSSCVDFPAF